MADSFSKKENFKKKLQKQQEKAKRREERKSVNNKGKSLEDMLVYVDINGNLTDLPPDQQEAEANKRQHQRGYANSQESDTAGTGTVTYYNEKGYGFIIENKTQDNLFVHSTDISQPLKKGDKVSYTKQKTSKGLRAVDVKII
ncbi:cold-shock protein [Myroides injenensis]|uniref:cold-shock protein n=1 Tax=Myroides injenensis TaxID=1183151 RepID=UPI000288DD46|nr:cold shock domain-containing protein [Myroides injenensis]